MSIQYRRVAAGFYTDSKIASFGLQPPHPTTFALWLLSGPVLGMVPGCASIGIYGMAEQSGWAPDQIEAMMKPLIDAKIVQFEPRAPFLYLPRALKYNAPKSPTNVNSWASDWRKLPNCVLKERAWHALHGHCVKRDEGLVFTAKKPRTSRSSFALAFAAVEKPPETPISAYDHRSDHRPHHLDDVNNNTNNNNNRNSGSENPTPNPTIDNVRALDFAANGGES